MSQSDMTISENVLARCRATLHGTGKDGMAECLSLCYLNSPAMVWTEEEGLCCPIQHVYLLFGLSVSTFANLGHSI